MGAALKDVKRAKAREPELDQIRGQLLQAQAELEKQRDVPANVSEEHVKLLMRAEKSERRAASLEEELQEVARTSAREVAVLKLKIAEKEAQLAGGFGTMTNLVLDELAPPRATDGLDLGLRAGPPQTAAVRWR